MRKRFKKMTAVLLGIIIVVMMIGAIPINAVTINNESVEFESTGNSKFDEFLSNSTWAEGAYWSDETRPQLSHYDSWSCCAYAADFATYCFGSYGPKSDEPFYDATQIRAGDVIQMGEPDGAGHWAVVLKRSGNNLYIADGNHKLNNDGTGPGYVRVAWCYTIVNSKYIQGAYYSFKQGWHFMSSTPAPKYNNYGDDFYALICTRNSSVVVGQSDSDNAVLVSNGINFEKCIFHFSRVNSDNGYVIRSAYNGKVLDVNGAYDANQTNVQFYPYHDHPAQVWYFEQRGEWCSMTAGCTSRVLNAYGYNVSLGTNLEMFEWNGKESQQYNIWKIGSTEKVGINYGNDFYAMIKSDSSKKPIGQQYNYNAELMTEKTENYNKTIWHFTKLNNNNAYRISSVENGRYLDVNGAQDIDRTNVGTYPYHDHPAQEWYIQSRDGYTFITSGCSSKYLDIYLGSHDDGSNLEIFTFNGGPGQRLYIDKIPETDFIPVITATKKVIICNYSSIINISNAQYAYNYQFHVIAPDGSETVIDNKCASAFSLTPTETGLYSVYAKVKYPYYTKTTDTVTINACGIADVNLDGTINISDVTALQRHLADLTTLTDSELAAADANGDGVVDINDATHLQKYLAEFNVALGKQS